MGIFLPMIIGSALSGIGAMIKNRQANNNAKAVADARNGVLRDTMALNRPIADSSRAAFDNRIQQPMANEVAAGAPRMAMLDAAVQPAPTIPVAGSAPQVVKSEIAKKMQEALEAGKSEAASSGRVASYGDAWFGEGIQNNDLASRLRQDANFAGGNLALLPHLQDLAEVGATRPSGPIADIFMGLGNAVGSAGGAGAFNRTPTSTVPPTTGLFQSVRNNFQRTP